MPTSRFNWFFLIRLAGIALFILILLRIDVSEVWNQLKQTPWHIFVITLGFVALQLFLKAWRWRLLNIGTKNEKTVTRSFGEFFESYAVGIVTPGRLGELLKAGYSTDKTGKISTGIRVFVERGLDFGFFLCLAGLALVWGGFRIQSMGWGLATFIFGIVSMGFSISLLKYERSYKGFEKILLFFRLNRQPLDYKAHDNRFVLAVLFISMISNAVYFISCYLLAGSISIDAGFLFISGGIAVAGLLNTIPMTIMGLGTRELTFLYVFNAYPAPLVMAFSALIFICWQIGSGILSLVAGEILISQSGKQSE